MLLHLKCLLLLCFDVTVIWSLKMEGHIVGGSETDINRFPHSVFLFGELYFHTFGCGSSVLNQWILLTAAHCVEDLLDIEHYTLLAFAGHQDLMKSPVVKKVDRFVMHQNYRNDDNKHDIALLFVECPLPLGKKYKVKRIWITPSPPPHIASGIVAGWGVTDDSSSGSMDHSMILKEVGQEVFYPHTCGLFKSFDYGMLCAGDINNSEDRPTLGDSGSGLIVNNHLLIGLVSFRNNLKPGLIYYTNVSQFYDWVTITAENNVCVECVDCTFDTDSS